VKRVFQLVVIPALGAGAITLLWGVLPTAQQQLIKDRVKVLLGTDPRKLTGPPSISLGPEPHGPGLFTGDEPPFSHASGPWSMVKYEENGQFIRPNCTFDFEIVLGMDSSRLDHQWSHSGEHAYRMAPGEEYSPAVRRRIRDVATHLAAVEVGLWSWSPSPHTLLTAVVSIDRGEKQLAWFGKDLQADTAAHGGQRLNGSFLIRDLPVEPNDIISVYLWKRGGAETFIDDMDIFFQSTEVPGRELGRALALDSLRTSGPAPPTYASLTVLDVPVDSALFKSNMPAPPTTLEAVLFGNGKYQLQFNPQDGFAWLQDPAGKPLALIRPWSPKAHRDVSHFDRVVAETVPQGVRITGCDVVRDAGTDRIASHPAPLAVMLQLQKK
jgi:hypothetical protein